MNSSSAANAGAGSSTPLPIERGYTNAGCSFFSYGGVQYAVVTPGNSIAAKYLDDFVEDNLVAVHTPVALDGEFEHVFCPEVGRIAMQMALLSFSLVGSTTITALHFPSLLTQGTPSQRNEFSEALSRLLRRARLVTWDGVRSDFPALVRTLPSLGLSSTGGDDHVDLFVEIGRRIRTGRVNRDIPLNLSGAAGFVLGPSYAFDKTYQLADWSSKPSFEMLHYAATDVIATSLLYERLLRDKLPRDVEPQCSPAEIVGTYWNDIVDTLDSTSQISVGLPSKSSRVASFIVSRCRPLAQLLIRQPDLRPAIVSAVDSGLRTRIIRSDLPLWVQQVL